jgi:ABC-2 type transport system permease protein
MIRLLFELVRKDWAIFVSDKKSMVLTFLVPIGIACFLGSLLGMSTPGTSSQKVDVAVVSDDHSAAGSEMVAVLQKSTALNSKVETLAAAKADIQNGKVAAAIVIGPGFGDQTVAAFSGSAKPHLQILTDPSRAVEGQIVKGVAIQSVTGAAAKTAYGTSDSEQAIPFVIDTQAQTSKEAAHWSGTAHAFAGMGVQALFFGAMEFGMAMMRDRETGIWSRMRASPVSPWVLLLGRLAGSAVLSLLTYLVVFAAGAAIFGFRINGSYLGFLLVASGLAVFVAATGLFIAALGKTEAQSRRLSILVILVMLMLGGAWVPVFLLPKWIQTISLLTPVRWAVDGIDAMTWKGEGFTSALLPFAILVFFGVVLAVFAGSKFRWEATGVS